MQTFTGRSVVQDLGLSSHHIYPVIGLAFWGAKYLSISSPKYYCWKKSCTTWDVSKPAKSRINYRLDWCKGFSLCPKKTCVNSNNLISTASFLGGFQPQQIILNHRLCVCAIRSPTTITVAWNLWWLPHYSRSFSLTKKS